MKQKIIYELEYSLYSWRDMDIADQANNIIMSTNYDSTLIVSQDHIIDRRYNDDYIYYIHYNEQNYIKKVCVYKKVK